VVRFRRGGRFGAGFAGILGGPAGGAPGRTKASTLPGSTGLGS